MNDRLREQRGEPSRRGPARRAARGTIVAAGDASRPVVASLQIRPNSVVGGATATGTVQLDRAAPTGGVRVVLKSTNPAVAAVDRAVVVRQRARTVTFSIKTTPVAKDKFPFISARSATSASATARSAQIEVKHPQVKGIVIPKIMTSGQEFTGTVTLNGPAPSGGFLVKLRPQNPGVPLFHPGSLTIAPGRKSGEFRGNVGDVRFQQSAQIVADGGGAVIPANTTLKP
jgi:hypothetical protein